jgi:hypothetical protein
MNRFERVLRRGGAMRAESMLDECAVTRPGTGAPTIDPDTGQMTPPAPQTVYAGRCTLRVPALADQPQRDDTALTESKPTLVVPLGQGPFKLGDVVTLTAVWDGNLDRVAGRSWRVIGLPEKTTRVDQRLELAEVQDAG